VAMELDQMLKHVTMETKEAWTDATALAKQLRLDLTVSQKRIKMKIFGVKN